RARLLHHLGVAADVAERPEHRGALRAGLVALLLRQATRRGRLIAHQLAHGGLPARALGVGDEALADDLQIRGDRLDNLAWRGTRQRLREGQVIADVAAEIADEQPLVAVHGDLLARREARHVRADRRALLGGVIDDEVAAPGRVEQQRRAAARAAD